MTQPSKPTTAQVALGLFIVGQLVFLAIANVCDVLGNAGSDVPKEFQPVAEQLAPGWAKQQGHFHHLTTTIGDAAGVWAQLTGQQQHWSLFAPNVYHQCAFPVIEIRWDDNSAKLFPSDNEPVDCNRFVRWGRFRLRRLESALSIYLYGDTENPDAATKEKWRGEIQSFMHSYGDLVYAYMRWRYRTFAKRHPELPRANEVVFLMHTFRVEPPNSADRIWSGPSVHRIARWLPGAVEKAGVYPYQMFNPVTDQFEVISK